MARTGAAALSFLEKLRDSIESRFHAEEESLRVFVSAEVGAEVAEIKPWDRAYWSAKQRSRLSGQDSEDLRRYFSIDAVLAGLFSIARKLFGISVNERRTFCGSPGVSGAVEVYHPDVRFFEMSDEASGCIVGSFFADFYVREDKQPGGWTDYLDVRGVAFMATDFQVPICGSFLSHDEVVTLFHEFGHLCHALLCESRYAAFSAFETPWDFVELPSQLLENFAWDRSALNLFSAIPDEEFDRLERSRHFQSATNMMGQLAFGVLDLELHKNFEKYRGGSIDEVERELLKRYRHRSSIDRPAIARDFGHVFGQPGYYASGYYSYHWAQVLDADVFECFRQDGVLSGSVGGRFRREILAKGAGEDPDVQFRNLMGRDPDPAAFLARNGI
jgi:oligopeptidase A